MQTHGHEQTGTSAYGHGVLRPFRLQLAGTLSQARWQKALTRQSCQQAAILVAMERQPKHFSLLLFRQVLQGRQQQPPAIGI
jgi:hypothetical protein